MTKKSSEPRVEFPLSTIVEVEWADACSYSRWEGLEEHRSYEPMPCRTAGYLIQKDKDKVVILSTQSLDDGGNGSLAIPATWVKSIKVLRK